MNLYSIPPLLTLCCFLGLTIWVIQRGRWTKTNILFFIICIFGIFLYIDILIAFNVKSPDTALAVSRIDHFFIAYLFPVYLHFFHSYFNVSKRKWLVRAAYAYAFVLMCMTPTTFYIGSVQKHFFGYFARAGRLFVFFDVASLFVTVYALILILQAIRGEKNNARRNRLKYLLAGFGMMGFMNGMDVLPLHGYSVYPPGNFSFIPLIVFAYGLFKHDLLDMGTLFQKGLIYSLLTACLTGAYALMVITANKVFQEFHVADAIYFPLLFFLLIAFVFGPLKTRIQVFVDRSFFKSKYDYQKTIKHVSRTIVSVLEYNDVTKLLMQTIFDVLKVERCALFLRNTPHTDFIKRITRGDHRLTPYADSLPKDSSLVVFMQNHFRPVVRKSLPQAAHSSENHGVLADMNLMQAEIALPLVINDTLKGVAVLGEKLSGDLYSREDLDLLETLADQSALAIENARSYKKIRDLTKNLEKKVEERTRDLKEALHEKERTQEQLIRSESLAAIGQLVAGVAHELNNPLASVTSLVQATIEDLTHWDSRQPPDENLIDDLKFADKELDRAGSIVTSLLGLSRQTHTYTEPVNLNTVVKDALRILHNQYKYHDLDIVEKYDRDLPDVHGNFANLGQVVLNLVQNAVQSAVDTQAGIWLETRFDEDARQVAFVCRDAGPGIPESIRKDIFKPFFTTKAPGEGTGLGLYICHEIIRRHSGTLTLRDTGGGGAQFEVRLPVDAEA